MTNCTVIFHCLPYPFTTENLSGYVKSLKVSGKDVLTVTGSGDQLLNLILNGAKRIDNFDVNINTYFYAQLKLAAIKGLEYNTYIYYFTKDYKTLKNEEYIMNYDIYRNFKHLMPIDVQKYWDNIYKYFNFNGKMLRESLLFHGGDSWSINKKSNDYLATSSNYNLLKGKIDQVKINFYNLDVLNLMSLYPNKYDVVLLSNIVSYLTEDFFSQMTSQEFMDYIHQKLSIILNDGGKIAVAYHYNYGIKKIKKNLSVLQTILQGKWQLQKLEIMKSFI